MSCSLHYISGQCIPLTWFLSDIWQKMLQITSDHGNEGQHCSLWLTYSFTHSVTYWIHLYQHWKTMSSLSNTFNLVLAENTDRIHCRFWATYNLSFFVKTRFSPKLKYIWSVVRFGIICTIKKTWKTFIELILVKMQAEACNLLKVTLVHGCPTYYFTFKCCYCWSIWGYEWVALKLLRLKNILLRCWMGKTKMKVFN